MVGVTLYWLVDGYGWLLVLSWRGSGDGALAPRGDVLRLERLGRGWLLAARGSVSGLFLLLGSGRGGSDLRG